MWAACRRFSAPLASRDGSTNHVEHSGLIAERLARSADVVGRERVIAGADCGFSTFAGFGVVDPDTVWMKFAAMECARIASQRSWGRA
jgi:5-methyltetrahydropteroyltriglutamate--homocysteine methyltransferase